MVTFDRLHQFSVDPPGHDFGLAHHELVTFSTHHFDESKLKLSASGHDKGVSSIGILNPQ